MQSLSEPEDKATQPRSRSRYGGRWELCSTCAAAAGAPGGGGQCFLLWQNHSSTVPKMNTIPAGMPMMTGQGRELEVGENMGMMGGFVSGKEEEREIKTGLQLFSVAMTLFLAQMKYLRPQTNDISYFCLIVLLYSAFEPRAPYFTTGPVWDF